MATILRNFGNSVGLVIPKPVRDALNLAAGQTVMLEQTENGLLVRRSAKKYTLEELLLQCDGKAPASPELDEWQEESESQGRELW